MAAVKVMGCNSKQFCVWPTLLVAGTPATPIVRHYSPALAASYSKVAISLNGILEACFLFFWPPAVPGFSRSYSRSSG
jgi:hypothetical protein